MDNSVEADSNKVLLERGSFPNLHLRLPNEIMEHILDYYMLEFHMESFFSAVHEAIEQDGFLNEVHIDRFLAERQCTRLSPQEGDKLAKTDDTHANGKKDGKEEAAGATSKQMHDKTLWSKYHKLVDRDFKNKYFLALQSKILFGYYQDDPGRRIFLVFPNIHYVDLGTESQHNILRRSPLRCFSFNWLVPWKGIRRVILPNVVGHKLFTKSKQSPEEQAQNRILMPNEQSFRALDGNTNLKCLCLPYAGFNQKACQALLHSLNSRDNPFGNASLESITFHGEMMVASQDMISKIMSSFPSVRAFESLPTSFDQRLSGAQLAPMKKLRQLRLSMVRTREIHSILLHCPNLQNLRISCARGFAHSALRSLPRNTSLRELRIELADFRGDQACRYISLNETLTSVTLQKCAIGDEGFSQLLLSKSITRLDVSRNGDITSDGVENMGQNNTLTSLNLSEHTFFDRGLASLLCCTSLTQLHLDRCGLAKLPQFQALAWSGQQSIVTLSLANNLGITKEALQVLMERFTNLRTLNLSECGLDNDAIGPLFEQYASIRHLDLSKNRLSSRSIMTIKNGSHCLKELNLWMNGSIGRDSIAIIVDLCPHIVHLEYGNSQTPQTFLRWV